jgi:CheY-like chemotaxis protein
MRDVTENLSVGGLLIRTSHVLAVGTRVRLQISFPGLLAPIEVEVEVVRRRPQTASDPGAIAVKIPLDRVDDRHKLARLVETARGGVQAPARRAYRVLVVEDNPHVVEMYEYALRRLGSADTAVSVEYAPHGHDALGRLEQPPPVDLVMADLYMPVMDGFALIERMRASPALMEIPILVISAGAADARARALELGGDVYLQKPVQFADVIATVRTLLRIPT